MNQIEGVVAVQTCHINIFGEDQNQQDHYREDGLSHRERSTDMRLWHFYFRFLQPEQETFIPVSDGDHYYNRGKGQDREQGDMLPPIGSNKHGSKQRSQ